MDIRPANIFLTKGDGMMAGENSIFSNHHSHMHQQFHRRVRTQVVQVYIALIHYFNNISLLIPHYCRNSSIPLMTLSKICWVVFLFWKLETWGRACRYTNPGRLRYQTKFMLDNFILFCFICITTPGGRGPLLRLRTDQHIFFNVVLIGRASNISSCLVIVLYCTSLLFWLVLFCQPSYRFHYVVQAKSNTLMTSVYCRTHEHQHMRLLVLLLSILTSYTQPILYSTIYYHYAFFAVLFWSLFSSVQGYQSWKK